MCPLTELKLILNTVDFGEDIPGRKQGCYTGPTQKENSRYDACSLTGVGASESSSVTAPSTLESLDLVTVSAFIGEK